MSTWQPIETAPRDDTVILIAGREGISTAQWKERRREWQVYTSENGWQECEVWPTHWMPLPDAPVSL
jgi:hypothetical protein